MQKKIRISIDAMGGLHAPEAVIEGAALACASSTEILCVIVGDRTIIPPLITRYKIPEDRYEFVPSQGTILDDEKPVEALKKGQNSSMRKAIDALKERAADACVSSGNTGALMVMSKLVLGTMDGVKRPAIIGTIPTMDGESVILDLGANVECNENLLFQFALMGSCFAKAVLHINNPKIGLINVGSEQYKGREVERKTSALLEKSGLHFTGYIEGDDVFAGKVDVVVTDGFNGNILLKTSEGVAKMIFTSLNNAFRASLMAKIGGLLVKPILKNVIKQLEPARYNGAMFIGINGIVVKSHGSSHANGVANAIKVAAELVRDNINEKILKELMLFEEHGVGFTFVDKIKKTSAKIFHSMQHGIENVQRSADNHGES